MAVSEASAPQIEAHTVCPVKVFKIRPESFVASSVKQKQTKQGRMYIFRFPKNKTGVRGVAVPKCLKVLPWAWGRSGRSYWRTATFIL